MKTKLRKYETKLFLKNGKSIYLLRKVPFCKYLKSRIVTPKEFMAGLKSDICSNSCLGAILFKARYEAGKAIVGYDFD
jgi:hypothetical protein